MSKRSTQCLILYLIAVHALILVGLYHLCRIGGCYPPLYNMIQSRVISISTSDVDLSKHIPTCVHREDIPESKDEFNSRHNFRRPNKLITSYDQDVARRLDALVERKASGGDPELVQLVRDMLDYPSTEGWTKTRPTGVAKSPQVSEVDDYLKNKVNISSQCLFSACKKLKCFERLKCFHCLLLKSV